MFNFLKRRPAAANPENLTSQEQARHRRLFFYSCRFAI